MRSITAVGVEKLRLTSIELTECLIAEATRLLIPLGFALGSPPRPSQRGGHVLLTHPKAHAVSVAIRQVVRVIGDFRFPDGLRLAPAYTTRTQIEEAVARIVTVVKSGKLEQVDSLGQMTI